MNTDFLLDLYPVLGLLCPTRYGKVEADWIIIISIFIFEIFTNMTTSEVPSEELKKGNQTY